MTSTGLLGFSTADLPQTLIDVARARAPWRGEIAKVESGPGGCLIALGAAFSATVENVSVVFHGRLDLPTVEPGQNVGSANPAASIAKLYAKYGVQLSEHLDGDFAFVLIDHVDRIMCGVRDWAGTRPLFWGKSGELTAFASEAKQVLALLELPLKINTDVLEIYKAAAWDDLAIDAMYLCDVTPVRPNGQVEVHAGKSPLVTSNELRFEPNYLDIREAGVCVREALVRSVRRRTTGAVNLGALVSGGMDSSSVLAAASLDARDNNGPLVKHSFTITYPEVAQSDESRYARSVAEYWDIPWHPVPVSPADLLASLDELLVVHDGPPFPGYAPHANLLLPRVAAEKVDVLLTGQAADAWLGAEDAVLELALLRRDWKSFAEWEWAYAKWAVENLRARRRPSTGFRQISSGLVGLATRKRPESYFEQHAIDYWGRVALETEERDGMRLGIRVEFPFADKELASLLAGLKPSVRSTPTESKRASRQAMVGLLPEDVRTRTDVSYADAVIRRAVGRYEGNWRPSRELARRYGHAWAKLIDGQADNAV